ACIVWIKPEPRISSPSTKEALLPATNGVATARHPRKSTRRPIATRRARLRPAGGDSGLLVGILAMACTPVLFLGGLSFGWLLVLKAESTSVNSGNRGDHDARGPSEHEDPDCSLDRPEKPPWCGQ